MTFTVEHVKGLLQGPLEKVKVNIISKIKQFPSFSQSKLYEHLTVSKAFRRTLLVEQGIANDLFIYFIYVFFTYT